MALIQINQKLLHIIIALLIYGVCMESVKCPDVCHCVETSVFFGANLTSKTESEDNISLHDTTTFSDGPEANNPREAVTSTTPPIQLRQGANRTDASETTTQTKSLNDIFVRHFSTAPPPSPLPPLDTFLIKNSKETTMKRTSNLNETFSDSGTTTTARTASTTDSNRKINERQSKGIAVDSEKTKRTLHQSPSSIEKKKTSGFLLTYQITCNTVDDPSSVPLKNLPNPTTQLVIRRATFASLAAFYATLRESSARLSLLTDLSITDSVVDGNGSDASLGHTRADSRRTRIREFLPFASLQNPRQRTASSQNSSASDLLLILNLSNNSLGFLPRDLFQPYPNLQTLDLSNNRLENLDNGVFSPLSNLLRLDLHGNRITSLAESLFENLGKLLTLDMSRNSVSDIAPSTFQYLTSLNTLILSDNPLSAKRQSMILLGTGKRLQIVDASKTGLKQIPGTLERSVRTLNLKGNYLSSIQCGDLDSYSLLTSLDLSDNKISYVEDDALGRLELLATFDVHENNLFQIPKSLPNNLQILNLSHNNIQNVTNSDFLNLSLLKELYIGYNQVNNVEDNSFDNLGDLRVLDLSHNPILVLPDMYGLFSLVSLDLSYFTNIPDRFAGKYDRFPVRAPENIRFLNLESSPLLARTFLGDAKTLASFVNLQDLRLRFSNLTTLGRDAFVLLPNLQILRVEGNPWHCDRDILRLSRWLRSHRPAGDPAPEDDGDRVNAARCATPSVLRRKALLDLHLDDFPLDGSGYDDSLAESITSYPTGSEDFPRETLSNIIPSGDGSREEMDRAQRGEREKEERNFVAGEIEDLSNASRRDEIDLGEGNPSPPPSSGSPLVPHLTRDTSASVRGNQTVDGTCCVNGRNYSDESSFASSFDHGATNGTEAAGATDSATGGSTTPAPDPTHTQTTESASGRATVAEAMRAGDSTATDRDRNAGPRLVLVTFVGAVALATTAATILHLARSRKDGRSTYERQSHDIEVHSISGTGNELW